MLDVSYLCPLPPVFEMPTSLPHPDGHVLRFAGMALVLHMSNTTCVGERH